ncbi:hypothetical protein ACGH7X_04020 [Streptomyces sp. BBFR51]|uniref:hypothetical protein n=1 Tax=Streptomyces sp. BBFR51 TaxID=3372856 RepID=UPI0037DD7912
MQGTELARAALGQLAGPKDEDSEERAGLRRLVARQLAGSELGTLALARLESSPGEDSESVARMVLAQAVDTDAAFASQLRDALVRALGARALGAATSAPPRPSVAPTPPRGLPPAVTRPAAQQYPALPGYVPLFVPQPDLRESARRPSVWWVSWLGLPQSILLLYVVLLVPGFAGEEYVWPTLSMFSAAVGVVLAVVGLARRPVQGMPMTGLTVGLLLDAVVTVFWLMVLTGRLDIDDVVNGII